MANKHLKPSLLTSAVAAGLVAVPMSASAQDLNLKISGQINKTLAIIDNGDNDAWGVLDNINSGSRFRFTGSQDVGNGAKMGGVWEWQWSNSSTSGNTFNSAGEFSERSAGLGDRKTELYYQAGWGKVSLGLAFATVPPPRRRGSTRGRDGSGGRSLRQAETPFVVFEGLF